MSSGKSGLIGGRGQLPKPPEEHKEKVHSEGCRQVSMSIEERSLRASGRR